RSSAVRDRKIDQDFGACRFPRERLDTGAEAVLDPLQDEAIGRGELEASGTLRTGERANQGGVLLRRKRARESGETGGPSRGSRCRVQGFRPSYGVLSGGSENSPG